MGNIVTEPAGTCPACGGQRWRDVNETSPWGASGPLRRVIVRFFCESRCVHHNGQHATRSDAELQTTR